MKSFSSLYPLESDRLRDIQQSLDIIINKLESEISARQRTIDLQEQELLRLQSLLAEKNNFIHKLNEQLNELKKSNEGSRQLVNKLLNDIDRLQQDVEWYNRTYVSRSFLGTIKQKLFGKRI